MSAERRLIRLQVSLTPEELRVIDDWQFEKRLPTRSAAVREIIRRGLKEHAEA